jgi:alpha-glucosidase
LSTGLGNVLGAKATGNSIEMMCDNGRARISVLGPKIIRVEIAKGETYRDHASVARVPYEEKTTIKLQEKDNRRVLTSKHFQLEITNAPFSLRLLDKSDNIISEDQSHSIEWIEDGFAYRKKMLGAEHFYGMGEKAHGLDKRGLRYEMWATNNPDYDKASDPLYQSIPFFLVLRDGIAYGIFLDNSYRTWFDFGAESEDEYSFGSPDGPLDYYIVLGPSLAEVVDGYTSLTGRPFLVPHWALGHFWSRWMVYESEDDVVQVAQEFRKRRIPCDTVVLDIGYMDEARVFTWDSKIFPDPKAFTDRLKELNFRVMAIIDPGVKKETGYEIYDEGFEKGYFLKNADGSLYTGLVWPGETVLPDFSRPEVRQWFGSKYAKLAEVGLSNSSWIDMNEPAYCMYTSEEEEYTMANVVDSAGNPWEPRMHNLYASGMAQSAYEGLKEVYPGERPFVLTRSGFSGYQRFAAMWTGDNHSNWEHLQLSIPMLLNLGLSGVPICGPDIGGFSDDVTGELLARWYQVGALYPFSRNHSRIYTTRQEPWEFGDDVGRIARDYMTLRYRLLRYLYSLAYEAHSSGIPMMRPLVMHFQDDPTTYTINDQFLLGSHMLVAPILEEGAVSRKVYLPEGIWYDLWTGTRIEGKGTLTVDAPLDRMPIFLRAGAIIPTGHAIQHTGEDQGDVIVWVYPGVDSEGFLFEDDGITEECPKALTQFILHSTDESLLLTVQEREGDWTPPDRALIFEIRGVSKLPSDIVIDGKSVISRESQKLKQTISKLSQPTKLWNYDALLETLRVRLHDDGMTHTVLVSL